MEKVREATPETKAPATPQVEQPKLPEQKTGPQMVSPSLASAAALPPPGGTPPAARAGDVIASSESELGAPTRARMATSIQRTMGNNRVSRMLGLQIQTKLTIGAPNDPYEQEADRVADQVMRMPQPRVAEAHAISKQPEAARGSGLCPECEEKLQRQIETEAQAGSQQSLLGRAISMVQLCPACALSLQRQVRNETGTAPGSMGGEPASSDMPGNNTSGQTKDETETTNTDEVNALVEGKATASIIHRAETAESENSNTTTPGVSPDTESYLNTTRGGGQSMPESSRAFMEPRFGQDFSRVRVHTDSRAAAAAEGLNAKAFTHGQDIYFGAGRYQPGIPEGQRLLGHELTHTLQQGDSTTRPKIHRKPTGNPPLTSLTFANPYFEKINADDKYFMKKWHPNSAAVKILQQALLQLNYPLIKFGADGKFGNETRSALMSFQRDAGFSEKEVDGVLGHKTLQALDARFSSAARKAYRSVPGGDIVLIRIFGIKRTYDDSFEDMHELLLLQLKEAFKISRDEAAKLIPSTPDETTPEGRRKRPTLIWWQTYTGVGPQEVEMGYKDTWLSKKAYDQYRARAVHIRGPAKSELEIEQEAKADLYKLQGKKRLYELYKELKHLDEAILVAKALSVASLAGVPLLLLRRHPLWKLEDMRDRKRAALDVELANLGITFAEFEKSIDNFLASFRKFAVLTAIRMLDSNETKTRIAQGQLQDLENVKEIKGIIAQLNPLYEEAETKWWKGVSHELRTPRQITGHEELDQAIDRSVKGLLFAGALITSVDMAYKVFAIYRYKDGEKGFLNDYFRQAQAAEAKAHAILAPAAQKYNILAYPDLDLKGKGKDYAKMSDPELQAKLAGFIGDSGGGVLANIASMKKELQSNPDLIWELKPVWTQAMRDLGLTKEDPQYQIIEKEVQRREEEKRLRDILLAIGGIALGLLALASGPLGWAALAGSIVVGSIDAYIQYQEISFLRTARRTALDPKDALSDVDPSWVWFYVSLAGIALDFLEVVKVVKLANTAKKGEALIAKTQDDLLADVARLEKLGNMDEAAKVRQLLETLEKNKAEFANHLDILLKLEAEPQLLLRLAEAMANEDVAKAIKALGAHLGVNTPLFLAALKFYGGIGSDFAEELPEVLRLVKQGGLKANPELLEEVLTQPALQKVLLDHPRDPDLLLREWAAWRGYKATGVAVTFADYLKNAGYAVDIKKGASLAAEFGKGFKELPNLAKNRQVLRQIEPKLMDALDAGQLPPRVRDALLRHLSDDIIGDTDDLARAAKRMSDFLGESLGSSLQTIEEYRRLSSLITNSDLARKILETATSLPGQGAYVALLAKHGKALPPDVYRDLLRIGVITDEDTFLRLTRDADFRKALSKYPEVVAAVKKCNTPCLPEIATADDVERLHKILKAHDDIDFAKLNEFLYQHRKSRAEWDKALDQLETAWENVFRGGFKGAGDIVIPDAYKAIKDLNKKIKNLVDNGLPPSLVEDILTRGAAAGQNGTQLLETMARAANKSSVRGMNNFGALFHALGSSDPAQFKQALELVNHIGRHSDSIKNVDEILTVIKLDDIVAIKNLVPEETVTVRKLYKLVTRIDGNREKILKLVQDSGVGTAEGTPDLSRLLKAIDNLGGGARNPDEILSELRRMGFKPELPEFKPTTELEKRFENELYVRWEKSMGKREGWKAWMREKLGSLSAEEFEKRLVKEMGLDPKDPLVSMTVQKIIADGNIDRFNLLRALSNAAETKRGLLTIGQLNELSVKGIGGVDQVVGDLAAGGNKFKGAWWMLRYVENQGLWNRIREFEFPTAMGKDIRRYDIRLRGGELLQFKSWESWDNAEFIRQFVQDWQRTGGNDLRWVFESTGDLSSKEQILNRARGAILGSDNAIIKANAKDILAALDQIIRSGDEGLGL